MQYASSYNTLKSGYGKLCGRMSDSYLEHRWRSLQPFGVIVSSPLFIRFVSDDTVHNKGFEFEFIAGSDGGKLCLKLLSRNF